LPHTRRQLRVRTRPRIRRAHLHSSKRWLYAYARCCLARLAPACFLRTYLHMCVVPTTACCHLHFLPACSPTFSLVCMGRNIAFMARISGSKEGSPKHLFHLACLHTLHCPCLAQERRKGGISYTSDATYLPRTPFRQPAIENRLRAGIRHTLAAWLPATAARCIRHTPYIAHARHAVYYVYCAPPAFLRSAYHFATTRTAFEHYETHPLSCRHMLSPLLLMALSQHVTNARLSASLLSAAGGTAFSVRAACATHYASWGDRPGSDAASCTPLQPT